MTEPLVDVTGARRRRARARLRRRLVVAGIVAGVLAVIGGTPSAIEPLTSHSVRLVPGTFEGNDVAKKVLRKLKEAVPESGQKALKAILNTEGVAAFVPPGGSDLKFASGSEGDLE